MSQAGLQDAIVSRLGNLSPALRKAADYVLANPDTVAMQSLRQIAEQSHLPPATYSRLARSLDLANYEVLRDLCRDEVRTRSRTFADKTARLQNTAEQGEKSFLREHAAVSIENIDRLVASIDDRTLAGIADMLTRARHVYLLGALSSAAIVDYVGYCAQMALANWRVVMPNRTPMSTILPNIEKRDAVLVLSQQPYAKSAIESAHDAGDRGASIIAITDGFDAPVADFADEVIVVPTESPHFFSSQIATVLLFEVLLSMIVHRTGQKARRRIAAVEQENHRSGEYWQG